MSGILTGMGFQGNPVTDFLRDNGQMIAQAGRGMIGGSKLDKMRGFSDGLASGKAADDAYKQEQEKQRQAQQQLNQTVEWMKQYAPQAFQHHQAGLPLTQAYELGMQEVKQAQVPQAQTEYDIRTVGDSLIAVNPYDPSDTRKVYSGAQPEQQSAEDARKQEQRDIQSQSRAAAMIGAIDSALEKSDWGTTGPMGRLNRLYGNTWAVELEGAVETVKANLGFQALQDMRDSSPTGGALGQVTERELALLQATVNSLDISQGEEQLDANLRNIRNLVMRNDVYRQLWQLGIPLDSPQAQTELAKYPIQGLSQLPQVSSQASQPQQQTTTNVPFKVIE